jgi:hypothetical protein
MAVRTVYLDPWTPPRFREQSAGAGAGIGCGTGIDEGGPTDLIGNITVLVSPIGQITEGQTVRLTAVRTGGSAPLTYQWSGPSGPIPGATSSTYSFVAQEGDSGTYTCTVTSAGATDSPKSGGAAIVVTVADKWLMEDSGFILMEDSGRFLLET